MTKLHGVPLKAWTQEYNRLYKTGVNEITVVRWLVQGLLRGHKKARCLKCGSPIYVFRETGIDFGTTFANTPCPNEYCGAIGLDTRTRGVWMVETPAESANTEVDKMRLLKRGEIGRPSNKLGNDAFPKIKLREVRRSKLISQVDLAKYCGVVQSTISQIENGRSLPSVDLVNKFAQVLKVNMKDLFANGYNAWKNATAAAEPARAAGETKKG